MSSPRLFEIVALSTLLSGQSLGQEISGILLSPDFSPHALRQDGNVLPNSGGLSSSFRAITPRKHADLPLAMAMGGCTGSEIIYRYTDDMPCEYGGRPDDSTYAAWMNNFVISGDAVVIEAIEIAFTNIPDNSPATVYLWSDPDGDGDPTDAQVLSSAVTSVSNDPNNVVRIDIPDTYVGEAGTSFFVGAVMAIPEPILDQFPIGLDATDPTTLSRGWLIGRAGEIDPNNLSEEAVEFNRTEDAFGVDFLELVVRAVSFGTTDCNANGIPDSDEINNGTTDDCNGNCIPDDCDLAENGDCNNNGLPDDCDFDGIPIPQYVVDDGVAENAVGLVEGGDHIWLNHFTTEANGESIRAIDVAWNGPEGATATVWVWADPDGDGNPSDAAVIGAADATVTQNPSGDFVTVEIPETFVGPPGTSFFLGVQVQTDEAVFVARIDQTVDNGESWLAFDSNFVDASSLSTAALFGQPANFGLPGNFLLRAISAGVVPPNDCNANGIPDECDLDSGFSGDCNQNGELDDCEILDGSSEDCDANGLPDDCDEDCNGDGINDNCQTPEFDCDNNGIEDICQETFTGVVGYYFNNPDFAGAPSVTRIDPAIDFENGFIPPSPLGTDNFSIRWLGALTSAESGPHTLFLEHDDDVRLLLNGAVVLDREGTGSDQVTVEFEAGIPQHLQIEYLERGGEQKCLFRWLTPSSGDPMPIPTDAFKAFSDLNENGIFDACEFNDCDQNLVPDNADLIGGAADCDSNGILDRCQSNCDCDNNGLLDDCELTYSNGLVGQYFASENGNGNFSRPLFARVDPLINFDFCCDFPPDPDGIPDDNFCVRWTGTITTPEVGGNYTFTTRSDDGARLWVDDIRLVNEWQPQSPTEHSGSIELAANSTYLIKMEYRQDGGGAVAQLSWTVPGQNSVIIPTEAFRPYADADGDGLIDICVDFDCNNNGLADRDELASGSAEDCNANCIPDECDLMISLDDYGLGHWRFEEGSGSTVIDASPYRNDGTINAVATREADVAVSPVPQSGFINATSLNLNWQNTSTGGFATIPDPELLLKMGNQDFTIEAWVKLDQISNTSNNNQRQYLCQKKILPSNDLGIDYAILVQRGNQQFAKNYGKADNFTGRELQIYFGDGSENWSVTSNLEITDLNWHYVTVSHDADNEVVRFGLDNTFEEIPFTNEGHDNSSGGPLRLGSHQNGQGVDNFFLRGSLDEFRISRGIVPVESLLNALGSPVSEDSDMNGVPDECVITLCPNDLDGSGDVGFSDLLQLLSVWGPCTGCPEDLDGSGAVDFSDLLEILSSFGACP